MSLVHHTLTFEVLTPLFMGGPAQFFRDADAGETEMEADAAVSVPGLVGRWRFWFRALVGGSLGPGKLKDLAAEERRLFGGISENTGKASSFRAWIPPASEPLRVNSADPLTRAHSQLRYLSFGMGSRQDPRQPARYAILPGQPFTVSIVTTDDAWARLKPTIELATILGGYGARHHRGLGSLRWIQLDGQPIPQPEPTDVIKSARDGLGVQPRSAQGDAEPRFPVLSQKYSRFRVCGPYFTSNRPPEADRFKSWDDALLAIRRQLRVEHREVCPDGTAVAQGFFALGPKFGFRHRFPDPDVFHLGYTARGGYPYVKAVDHDTAWHMTRRPAGRNLPVLQNPMFGLPLAYAQRHWSRTVNLTLNGDSLRRPSPVSFTVTRDAAGYRVIVGLFRSAFMPSRAQVKMTHNRHDLGVGGIPNWGYLDAFFDGCIGVDIKV